VAVSVGVGVAAGVTVWVGAGVDEEVGAAVGVTVGVAGGTGEGTSVVVGGAVVGVMAPAAGATVVGGSVETVCGAVLGVGGRVPPGVVWLAGAAGSDAVGAAPGCGVGSEGRAVAGTSPTSTARRGNCSMSSFGVTLRRIA
jgi:hypothetical protein